MQQNVFLAIALCGCGFTIKAQQDDASLRYVSNKTEDLDAANTIKGTKEEKVTVDITKTAIRIAPGDNPAKALTGSFTGVSCLWKEAFNNGKTIISTTLSDQQGHGKNATVTIEGADGKITILLQTQECPGCITRLLVDKHEELHLN